MARNLPKLLLSAGGCLRLPEHRHRHRGAECVLLPWRAERFVRENPDEPVLTAPPDAERYSACSVAPPGLFEVPLRRRSVLQFPRLPPPSTLQNRPVAGLVWPAHPRFWPVELGSPPRRRLSSVRAALYCARNARTIAANRRTARPLIEKFRKRTARRCCRPSSLNSTSRSIRRIGSLNAATAEAKLGCLRVKISPFAGSRAHRISMNAG